MQLPHRLQACADYVRPDTCIVDVGTDHAKLACFLGLQGRQVLATDINQKPLEAAMRTIEATGTGAQVKTRLSNGLQQVSLADGQDIIIAGMGGELIFSIIMACDWIKDPACQLILQPMTQTDFLRQSLAQNGFCIQDETAVSENRHCYSILRVCYTGERHTLSPLEGLCGCHLKKAEPSSKEYLKHQQKRLCRKLQGLQSAETPNTTEVAQIETLLASLQQILD